jgi:hypothetical protein
MALRIFLIWLDLQIGGNGDDGLIAYGFPIEAGVRGVRSSSRLPARVELLGEENKR